MTYTPKHHQERNLHELVRVYSKHHGGVDLSDTGTGKTFTALWLARELGVKPLIVCPKAIIPTWRHWGRELGVPILDVVNVEKLKAGRTGYLTKKSKREWSWTLPGRPLVIFDEAHCFGGYKTENAYIMAHAYAQQYPVLALSATIADNPMRMQALGYIVRLHRFRDYYEWCLRNGCYRDWRGGMSLRADLGAVMCRIHAHILPEYGVRTRHAEINDFPESLLIPEAYTLDKYQHEAERIYKEMADELKEDSPHALVVMGRARQRVELLKVPLLVDLACDVIEEQRSVVVFVGYVDTAKMVQERMLVQSGEGEVGLIYGDTPVVERDRLIAQFQRNELRAMVCTIGTGGLGLSMHDVLHQRPRSSIISPTFSAKDLRQTLGRTHRAGGTRVVQRLVYVAGTVEEQACKRVQAKLANLDLLNDGDLMGVGDG